MLRRRADEGEDGLAPHGSVTRQVPNDTNGRPREAEQGTALLTATSRALFGPDPVLVPRASGAPDRRKKVLVAPLIVSAKRLPA